MSSILPQNSWSRRCLVTAASSTTVLSWRRRCLVEGLANIQGEPLTRIDDACVALKTVSESGALVSSVSETWLYNPVEFTKILLSKTRRDLSIELNHYAD